MKFYYCYVILTIATLSCSSTRFGVVNAASATGSGSAEPEICYCAPNSYKFTLDFSLTCPPVNITLGDAVAATNCFVTPFVILDPEVSDLVPVSVPSIEILEFNQNGQVIVQENIGGLGLGLDGNTFSYISYAAIPGMIVDPEDLPRGIQVNIVGLNKDGEEIINVYQIAFTNACGAYPVLSEGQSIGWTRFSDLGPPDQEYCPAAYTSSTPSDSPFDSPSSSPSDSPFDSPSSSPSDSPSDSPSSSPSDSPSDSPSSSPSDSPTSTPSDSPSDSPTFESVSPSSIPSSIPSKTPSSLPSLERSSMPSAGPNSMPSSTPSGAPSSLPSLEPSSIMPRRVSKKNKNRKSSKSTKKAKTNKKSKTN